MVGWGYDYSEDIFIYIIVLLMQQIYSYRVGLYDVWVF